MPRRPREDHPGAWHHVMNRGVAHRPVFESRVDMRKFLALLAGEVRSERVEVHAYCLLPTHYHLLLKSPRGELDEAMRRIQNGFVRWFNRSRSRDGALFRGRFASRPVTTDEYHQNLVGYIDENPVAAGLSQGPGDYPFGSAHHFASGRFPPWFETSWIRRFVARRTGCDELSWEAYVRSFGATTTAAVQRQVEGQIVPGRRTEARWDLVDAAPGHVLEWMQRQCELADGTGLGQPLCAVAAISAAVDACRSASSGRVAAALRGGVCEEWLQIEVALHRLLAGATFPEIAARCALSPSGARKIFQRHRLELSRGNERYGERVRQAVTNALERERGGASATLRGQALCWSVLHPTVVRGV